MICDEQQIETSVSAVDQSDEKQKQQIMAAMIFQMGMQVMNMALDTKKLERKNEILANTPTPCDPQLFEHMKSAIKRDSVGELRILVHTWAICVN
jgi:hypothetical protein